MTSLFLIEADILLRILLAAVLGGLLGAERDLNARPAGLRTGMLIAVSSCIFTIISAEGFTQFSNSNPSYIAAQIVSGVGFLGAGALIHGPNRVLGLTTAADIWLVAAIGMLVGVHMYAVAVVVTLLAVSGLFALAPLSYWLEKKGEERMKRNKRPVVEQH